MKNLIFLFILTSLFSCNLYEGRKDEVLITDKDYYENYREYSPNKKMLLINYSIDLGAFGYGQCGTAILKTSDTAKNLKKYTVGNKYIRLKWIDNNTINSKIDVLDNIRNAENIVVKNIEFNKIKIIVDKLDYIENDYHLEVVKSETSPNGKYEMVAYRYLKNRQNINFIHISIIKKGKKIPKYGNYYIGDNVSDYILGGNWNKKNELNFYSNKQYSENIQYYFVKNRKQIKYNIIIDENKYGSKYRWI